MGKIAKQDRQVPTKSPPTKEPVPSAKGKQTKTPQPTDNGPSKQPTSIKEKNAPTKQTPVMAKQKKAPVKGTPASNNAVDTEVAPRKPSDVVREQTVNSGNPGHTSAVEVGAGSKKNESQKEATPATKVETGTTVPVREATAKLEERVASEIADKEQNGVGQSPSGEEKSKENGAAPESGEDKEVSGVEFCWNASHASTVQVTGSFNGWEEKLDMKEVDDAWKVVIPLEKGRYSYKFIVDGEWCYDITKENEFDNDGNINNIVTV